MEFKKFSQLNRLKWLTDRRTWRKCDYNSECACVLCVCGAAAMSTVKFKSNRNNRSLTVTLQRTIHLYRGSQTRSLWPPAHSTWPCHWSSCSCKYGPRLTGQEYLFHVLIAIGRKQHKRSHVVLSEYRPRGLQTGY